MYGPQKVAKVLEPRFCIIFHRCKPPEERFFTRVQSVIPFTVTKPNVKHVLNTITVAK